MARSQTPAAPRPTRRGWVRRSLRWGGIIGVLLIAILTIGAHHAWKRRLRLANEWLAGMALPVQVRLGGLEWHLGHLIFNRVEILDAQNRLMGHVEEIKITVTRRAVSERTLEGAALKGVRWTATPEQWKALLTPSLTPSDDSTESAEDTSGQPWRLEQLVIEDATVELSPHPGAQLAAQFSWRGGALAWDSAVGLSCDPQRVAIEKLVISAPDGGRLHAEDAAVGWHWDETSRELIFSGLRWPRGELALTPGLVHFFARETTSTPEAETVSSASRDSPTTRPLLTDARLGEPDRPLHVSWRFPEQPEIQADLVIEGRSLAWGKSWELGGASVQAGHVAVTMPAASPIWLLGLEKLSFTLQRPAGQPMEFGHVEALAPRFEAKWPENQEKASVPEPDASPPSSPPEENQPLLVIREAAIREGMAHLSKPLPETAGGEPLRAESHFSGNLRALALLPGGHWQSSEPQTAALNDTRLTHGEQELATWSELTLEVIPKALPQHGQIERLVWRQPTLVYPGDLVRTLSPPETSASPAPASTLPTAQNAPDPPWQRWLPKHVEISDGTFVAKEWQPEWPSFSGRFQLQTPQPEHYTATLNNLTLEETSDLADRPPLRVGSLVLEADVDGLAHHEVRAVRVRNADMRVGSTLRRLSSPAASSSTSSAEAEAAPSSPAPPAWSVEELTLDTTRVEIADVLPLLDPVAFDLAFSLKEVPLSAAGLAAHTARQKIEVAGLKLHSAYGGTGSLPVAEFPHIFLECSLADLLGRRIDRVEIISPVIYVGEQLFWYVDYFRQEKARAAAPTSTAATTSDPPSTPAASSPSWTIGQMEAHFGKMRLALKGSVIDALPALPFSCSTQLEEGRVHLTLDIPRDTYRPASGLPLEIDVLEGTASFNYPLQERDNNLVQVFRASELRYKQLKAQDVFFTVTYDQRGAYARFGGKLYGGYLSGGGDLYLDDNVSWDGWLDARDIGLGPLTQALTPEYFTLSGSAQFNVMAYGDTATLNIATGNLETTSPGLMSLNGLDQVKEKLPAVWRQLERSLANLSLDAFRDFPYDRGEILLKLYHQEGDLNLGFHGPRGTRAFQVKLHNHRDPSQP